LDVDVDVEDGMGVEGEVDEMSEKEEGISAGGVLRMTTTQTSLKAV
jgi:hypothetical protein